jgi:serine/threonine protein phosphatase PrpC
MGIAIDHAGLSTTGRRANNEDSLCAEPTLGLYAVADGMGGYEGGEIASRLAVETLAEFLRRNRGDDDVTWPFAIDPALDPEENLVSVAVRLAHREVTARQTGKLDHMGSTLALLVANDSHAVLAHVGDSRIYRLRAGRLEPLTRDHSLWAELQASGMAGLPSREAYQYSHVITRALGMTGDTRPDVRRERLVPGDVYLLCTDGVTEKLSDEVLADLLASPRDAQATCRAIVDAAFAAGGRDNITAVVLRVQASSSPPSSRP